ncbi:MAG: hypothetical protein R3D81_04125 [Thalassovita sp.]
MKQSSTVVTHAATEANRANPRQFPERSEERHAGTRLGRQELDGVLMEEAEGAVVIGHDRKRPWMMCRWTAWWWRQWTRR